MSSTPGSATSLAPGDAVFGGQRPAPPDGAAAGRPFAQLRPCKLRDDQHGNGHQNPHGGGSDLPDAGGAPTDNDSAAVLFRRFASAASIGAGSLQYHVWPGINRDGAAADAT